MVDACAYASVVSAKVQFDITPLTPTIGAEIRGLNCSEPFDAETLAAVRAAWLEHLVLFFPDQHLTPGTQAAFASQFGAITEGHPVEPSLEANPNVLPIDSVKDRTNFWHTDVTFMSKPPTGSFLYTVTIPDSGGDTMWANTRAAYDTLAEPLQHLCDDLTAIHFDPYYAAGDRAGRGQAMGRPRVEQLWPVEHPVVRVHPGDRPQESVREPAVHRRLEGFPTARRRRVPAHAVRPHDPVPVRRAVPLETRFAGVLGQPHDDALRHLRLRRRSPGNAPRDARRRAHNRSWKYPGMTHFKVGDKVIITEGDFKGERGAITDKHVIGDGLTVALEKHGKEIKTHEAHVNKVDD